jgi:DNA invertase Pin-like site-specific DNA recombinase
MKGQILGYVRVSSLDQNTDRQLVGVEVDLTFTDKLSGKNIDRPQLEALQLHSRAGDVVVIHSLDRLARNLSDLLTLVKYFTAKGVTVRFIKENLTFDGSDSPMANLTLAIFGAVAEFERAIISERQREGIAIAKQKGVYKGRKPCLTNEQILRLKEECKKGNKAAVAREYGITRETLYKYLKTEIRV